MSAILKAQHELCLAYIAHLDGEIAAMRRMDAQDARQAMQEERDRGIRCGNCHEEDIVHGECQNCGSIVQRPAITAYKLLSLRHNGTLGPLFINRRMIVPIGKWLEAECFPTKGYAVRHGWHTMPTPKAPHLSEKGRVWCEVRIEGFQQFQRPASQGGMWYLAKRMLVVKVIRQTAV